MLGMQHLKSRPVSHIYVLFWSKNEACLMLPNLGEKTKTQAASLQNLNKKICTIWSEAVNGGLSAGYGVG